MCRAPAIRRCRCRRWRNVERGIAPLVVNHQGQFPSITITYNIAARHPTMDDATAAIQQAVARLHIPDTIHADFAGDVQAFQQTASAQPLLLSPR